VVLVYKSFVFLGGLFIKEGGSLCPMKCIRCTKQEHARGDLCTGCFLIVLEKRMMKQLRNILEPKDQEILVVNDGSAAGSILQYVLQKVFKNTKRNIVIKSASEKGYDRVFFPLTQDHFLGENLEMLFRRGNIPKKGGECILRSFSMADLEYFAQLKHLEFTPAKISARPALDTLEEKYPGSKNAMVKSLLFFDEVVFPEDLS